MYEENPINSKKQSLSQKAHCYKCVVRFTPVPGVTNLNPLTPLILEYRGALTVVSADNLASQLIGGYKALNSAFRKCRYCMATEEQIQNKVRM